MISKCKEMLAQGDEHGFYRYCTYVLAVLNDKTRQTRILS